MIRFLSIAIMKTGLWAAEALSCSYINMMVTFREAQEALPIMIERSQYRTATYDIIRKQAARRKVDYLTSLTVADSKRYLQTIEKYSPELITHIHRMDPLEDIHTVTTEHEAPYL